MHATHIPGTTDRFILPLRWALCRQTEGSQPELVAEYTSRQDALDALRDLTVDSLGDLGHEGVLDAGNETHDEGCAVLWVEVVDPDGDAEPELRRNFF